MHLFRFIQVIFVGFVPFRYLLMKTHQLPVSAFLSALQFMEVEDIDLDEVQCIVANLIYLVSVKSVHSKINFESTTAAE